MTQQPRNGGIFGAVRNLFGSKAPTGDVRERIEARKTAASPKTSPGAAPVRDLSRVTEGRFWFGRNLPTDFQDPIVLSNLSFNGQLHFLCSACDEVIWADPTFGRHTLETGSSRPCPKCKSNQFTPIAYAAIDSRLCQQCLTQAFTQPGAPFTCAFCGSHSYVSDAIIILPPYPKRLYVLGHDKTPRRFTQR